MRRVTGRDAPANLMIVGLTLALLWPAVVNRQPFLFSDTSAYVRGFDAAIYKATGIASDWTTDDTKGHARASASRAQSRSVEEQAAPTGATSAKPGRDTQPVLSGRSIYYGALIYLSDLVAGFWPLVLLQAALVAIAIVKTLRRLLAPAESRAVGVGTLACLVLLTPLAYFTDLAMPDIFGALAILAAASLLFMWRTDDRVSHGFWAVLLAASLVVHSANLLVVLGMAAVGLLMWAVKLARIDRNGLIALVLAIVVAQMGETAFSFAVRKATGHPPIRPPFVTARLIDDGPGMDYLRRTCPGSGFAACGYLDRLPLSSDKFLWAAGRGGVFSASSPADQRKLAAEDTRFARSVLADRPAVVIGTTIASIGSQFGQREMQIFNYPPFRVEAYREKLPADTMADVTRTRAYVERMPVRYLEIIDLPIAALSFAMIGFFAWRNRRRQPQLAAFTMLVAAAFIVNGVVFGALSTPHGRYQNRIIWLLPLLALPLAARRQTSDSIRQA
jgi:hypothetical protein